MLLLTGRGTIALRNELDMHGLLARRASGNCSDFLRHRAWILLHYDVLLSRLNLSLICESDIIEYCI